MYMFSYIKCCKYITLYVCKLSTTQLNTASRPTGIVTLKMGSPNFGVSVLSISIKYTKIQKWMKQ